MRGYYEKTLVLIDRILTNYLNNSGLNWDHFISPISKTCEPNASVRYHSKDTNKTLKSKTILFALNYELKFVD